jgi:peptidoglycan hydrolase-like protein with peptidoglycan-binding domain
VDLILHQNLRAPIPARGERYVRNGYYNSYTKAVVTEAHILQKHLKRLGFYDGEAKIDGIIGPKTKQAILNLQRYLGTPADGYVGPKTRALLNKSC